MYCGSQESSRSQTRRYLYVKESCRNHIYISKHSHFKLIHLSKVKHLTLTLLSVTESISVRARIVISLVGFLREFKTVHILHMYAKTLFVTYYNRHNYNCHVLIKQYTGYLPIICHRTHM